MEKDRQNLRKAIDAMHRTSAAIESLIDSEAALSALDYLSELYPEVSCRLHESADYICDHWEQIINNGAKRHETSLFLDEYDSFREMAIKLDDWHIDNIGKEFINQETSFVTSNLIILIGEIDRLFSYIFNEIKGGSSTKATSLRGLTGRLSKYLFGIDDELLSKAILKRDFPVLKPTWIGKKNEATYFGKHFKLSCEDMNNIFLFQGKNRQAMKLNYSKNDDDKITAKDDIAMILSDFCI